MGKRPTEGGLPGGGWGEGGGTLRGSCLCPHQSSTLFVLRFPNLKAWTLPCLHKPLSPARGPGASGSFLRLPPPLSLSPCLEATEVQALPCGGLILGNLRVNLLILEHSSVGLVVLLSPIHRPGNQDMS